VTLIGTGVAVAFLYSAVATIAPQVFRHRLPSTAGRRVFRVAAVIVSLTLLGQLLELRARSRTSAAIKALLGLAPKTARRLRDDGGEEDVGLSQVHVGDRVRVRPARGSRWTEKCSRSVERRRVDVDRRGVRREDGWFEGHRRHHQRSGSLVMRPKGRRCDGPVPNRATVGAAQRSRAPLQRMADRVAYWFVLAVFAIALVTFVVGAFLDPIRRGSTAPSTRSPC